MYLPVYFKFAGEPSFGVNNDEKNIEDDSSKDTKGGESAHTLVLAALFLERDRK